MDKEKKEVEKVKKFKFTKFIIIILLLYLFGFFIYELLLIPTKNIFISDNYYLTDQEIIDISGLKNYPSFFFTTKLSIKNKLLKNNMIQSVEIKKEIFGKIYITVTENTPLFYNSITKETILNNGKSISSSDYIVPVLTNEVDSEVYEKLVEKMATVDINVLSMISEIEYDPNDIDTERFLLTMNDGNFVYITLTKISSLNEYIDILASVEGNKGILYLDSGNYFEILE
ncbi:MAG TPA: FtsQ-type POTRA domain-containing protein [Bacilli bacterium]|nr:FtsQ-type POTRA domain-containing protein [Bacilli bacterium]